MCMKHVNAIVGCYGNVVKNELNQVISYEDLFDEITAIQISDDKYAIRHFVIVTNFTILGTNKEERKSDNPICREDCIHVTIRLTKCAEDPQKRVGTDLTSFDIDIKRLKSEGKLSKACYPFLNLTQVTSINEIKLPSNAFGSYVIKVLVRNTKSPDDDTIHHYFAG